MFLSFNEARLFVDNIRTILGICVKQIQAVGDYRRRLNNISSIDFLIELSPDSIL